MDNLAPEVSATVVVTPADLRSRPVRSVPVELANDSLGAPSLVGLPPGSVEIPNRIVLEIAGQPARVWEWQTGRFYRRVRDRHDWGIVRPL